jgi:hypothetical protein
MVAARGLRNLATESRQFLPQSRPTLVFGGEHDEAAAGRKGAETVRNDVSPLYRTRWRKHDHARE